MRIIGVDYGTKRIGVAVSDDAQSFSFPKAVIPMSPKAFEEVVRFATDAQSDTIVLGESKDFSGRSNTVMGDIKVFKKQLEAQHFTVILEPEYWSSEEAVRFQGKGPLTDASAAAIILQRYLDKLPKK